jgi:hypothetical protein
MIRSGGASSRQRMILPRGIPHLLLIAVVPANVALGANVLTSYNDSEANQMLNELEKRRILPGCDTSIGPFSVFRGDMTGPQSGITHHKGEDKLNSCEDKSENQSPLRLLAIRDECGSEHDVAGQSRPRIEAAFTHVPDVDRHATGPNEVVALLHPSRALTHQSSDVSSFWMEKLLSHYMLRVADVLQPVYHPQNPFRSIHAQYAMSTSTKPLFDQPCKAATGSISHRVILHSILSTAAFHLRGRSNARYPGWEFYDHLGRCLRLQALKYLQQAIVEPSLDEETHCARFSAILTLVTSDVGAQLFMRQKLAANNVSWWKEAHQNFLRIY